MKAYKYLFVLALPMVVYISFTSNGWLTFLPLILFFYILPVFEFFIKPNPNNFTKEQANKEKSNKVYTFILYLVFVIHIGFLFFFFKAIQQPNLSIIDYIGRTISMGLMCGITGINVAHELGHRNNKTDTLLAEILLLTSLNTHFLPYHNAGHHLTVATPNDAATAKINQNLYTFWFTSHFKSYKEAWKIENKKLGKKWLSFDNKMVDYSIANVLTLIGVFLFFGATVLIAFICASVYGIMLLETVNYIEHYGLTRKMKSETRFEKVKRIHSWNSDHNIGKLILFNLSRHSDHHYNGAKHYQLLNSMPESPQMPTGYPGMMLLATIPPLWFKVMNRRIEQIIK
jgi:alkane 1-monooxygenase